jgi:hypothetical protein
MISNMKNKFLSFITAIFIAVVAVSCSKDPDINSIIGEKDKIDIKGSLMNGDMKNPNIEAGYLGKTVYVFFHDDMGVCTVSIANAKESIIFREEQSTFTGAEMRFYMGDQPMGRYHLVISNGTDTAEGWFKNYKIVSVKPKK